MTADGFSMEWTPPSDVSEQTLKALDDVADGGKGLDEGLEGADFTYKLRGEDITLDNVKLQEVIYIKRSEAERRALRKAFEDTRKEFLIMLLEDETALKKCGPF